MSSEKNIYAILINLAAFVIVIAGMHAARTILVPFFLAVFITVISSPLIYWLENRKVPRLIAVILVAGIVVAFLLGIGAIINASANDFMENLPHYKSSLKESVNKMSQWAADHRIKFSNTELMRQFDPSLFLGFAGHMLGSLGGILSNMVLILIAVGFMLFESTSFPRKLHTIFADSHKSLRPFREFIVNINRYLLIKTITSFATGLMVTVWVLLFDIDYPFLWGLLAFLLNFVPTIGSIMAAVPAVLLALIQYDLYVAVWVSLGYLVINNVISNIIEPRFMGQGLGLSPLVVFLSLAFWGWVLGPAGMFLSVPLTMTVKIALDSNENTRWIGVILGR